MMILDGREVSKAVRERLRAEVQTLSAQRGFPPGLAVILVGADPASQVYVRNKEKACESLGIHSVRVDMDASTTEDAVLKQVRAFNDDAKIDGILVQMPLPKQIRSEKVLETISPEKDADGLTTTNMGLLWTGKKRVVSCTPLGVMRILEHYQISVAGKNAVVIGRSQIVGRPMAHLLSEADATVTICHSKTADLRDHLKRADIVVVAAGKKRFLGKDDFKQNAVVIDVGIHGSGSGGSVCGDVRFEELEGWASAATPVPGGVGPMTITTLLENTISLARLRSKK